MDNFINSCANKFKGFKEWNFWKFISKHPEIFTIIGLSIAFYYIFFNDI